MSHQSKVFMKYTLHLRMGLEIQEETKMQVCQFLKVQDEHLIAKENCKDMHMECHIFLTEGFCLMHQEDKIAMETAVPLVPHCNKINKFFMIRAEGILQ